MRAWKSRHRPGGHQANHPQQGAAEQVRVEWSETEGTVTFPGGQCVLVASGDALLLRAEAADAGTLELIENLIASHIDRFSRREPLTVTWQPAGGAGRPGPRPSGPRNRRLRAGQPNLGPPGCAPRP